MCIYIYMYIIHIYDIHEESWTPLEHPRQLPPSSPASSDILAVSIIFHSIVSYSIVYYSIV